MDEKLRAQIDEMWAEMDAAIKPHEYDADTKRFLAAVELAKRGFGQWDECDPVVWALLRVVTAAYVGDSITVTVSCRSATRSTNSRGAGAGASTSTEAG